MLPLKLQRKMCLRIAFGLWFEFGQLKKERFQPSQKFSPQLLVRVVRPQAGSTKMGHAAGLSAQSTNHIQPDPVANTTPRAIRCTRSSKASTSAPDSSVPKGAMPHRPINLPRSASTSRIQNTTVVTDRKTPLIKSNPNTRTKASGEWN